MSQPDFHCRHHLQPRICGRLRNRALPISNSLWPMTYCISLDGDYREPGLRRFAEPAGLLPAIAFPFDRCWAAFISVRIRGK